MQLQEETEVELPALNRAPKSPRMIQNAAADVCNNTKITFTLQQWERAYTIYFTAFNTLWYTIWQGCFYNGFLI